MARVNPDPYAGGRLFALVHRVTGLLDSEDEVHATVEALEADGVALDDIDIFTGEQGARCLDLFGREHGRALRLLRTLESAMGVEADTNHRIDDALHKGGTLLCVRINGTLKKHAGKAHAFEILKALHAHEIHYWGPWGVQDVPSMDRECPLCTLSGERILGENDHALWVLDLHPVSPGHSLIVSKRHGHTFFEAAPAERDGLLALLAQAREQTTRTHTPAGYNIGLNEGPAAGQMVMHLHLHLIPRFTGDRKNPRGGVRWVIPEKADYWTPR